jgi:hypothetical protein
MRKTLQKKSHENSHHAMLNSDSKDKFLQKKQEIERYVVQIYTDYKKRSK